MNACNNLQSFYIGNMLFRDIGKFSLNTKLFSILSSYNETPSLVSLYLCSLFVEDLFTTEDYLLQIKYMVF